MYSKEKGVQKRFQSDGSLFSTLDNLDFFFVPLVELDLKEEFQK